MTDHLPATVFICVTCKGTDTADGPPGRRLYDAVSASSGDAARITAVECLAVCKRPCTVAITAAGKWTYVVGDLDPEQHVADVIAAAQRYAASETGIIPWRERPLSFRKGIVSRVPPVGFRPDGA